ncbi:MAG: AAA family ATPase, partial [Gemmataceae bacterium]|nr:AAA family ATPase [Gemmataceae bacterium]
MNPLVLDPRPLDRLLPDPAAPAPGADWVWDGYLARGNLTLLTSRWKAGKTTLIAGLLRALGAGTPFLGRPVAAGHAVVLSEESPEHWAARGRAIPAGPHARLVSRPFP